MRYRLQEFGERSDKPSSPTSGFTLIELTVVILTCALLGSLVLPALARSGDGGKRTVCYNNLRQLGMSLIMYGYDNRDYLAQPNWNGVLGNPPGWLYTLTNGVVPDPGPGGIYSSNPVAAYATGLWFQYTRDARLYLCPVDIESPTYKLPSAQGGRAERLSSYVMNGAVDGYGGTTATRTCRITEVWSPDCYLLWGPDENASGSGNPGTFLFNDGANFPSTSEGGIEQLHALTGGHILTVGGAVQFVSVQRFVKESTASGKSLAWWNPYSANGR
ncbi:MAG: type II secretion system protein [Verrucomicrobia bacterium]|nr:type II secretion system protein [Verrucomicrobiota bacterium]